MTEIEIGRAYLPTDPDWTEALAQLKTGDEVDRWFDDGSRGRRGALVVDMPPTDLGWVEFTLRRRSTAPEWDGHAVVVDRTRDVWLLVELGYNGSGSRYSMGGGVSRTSREIEEAYGPCLPLLDERRRVNIATVLKLNEVDKRDLTRVIEQHDADRGRVLDGGFPTMPMSRRTTSQILKALWGPNQ